MRKKEVHSTNLDQFASTPRGLTRVPTQNAFFHLALQTGTAGARDELTVDGKTKPSPLPRVQPSFPALCHAHVAAEACFPTHKKSDGKTKNPKEL